MSMMGRPPIAEMAVGADLATKMADETNMALVTLGRSSGEFRGRQAEAGDFYLSDVQRSMLQAVS